MQKMSDRKYEVFEELALPLREELLLSALKLSQNHADAEDLVQDTYLRAYRFFHQFEEGTNFRAWIFTILRNVFISRRRQSQLRPSTVEEKTLDLMIPESDSEEAFLAADAVRVGLEKLPEDYRRVIALADLSGLKYREIAEVLGRPIGTVMSRMFRAREELREHMKEVA